MINRKSKAISRALIIMFLLTTLITYWAPGIVRADTNINDLAIQAIRNQYNSYQNGAAVNGGGYTDFSSYNAYILDLAGADLNTWIDNNVSLKSSVITLIDATIANEGTGSQASSKRVVQDYLAAKSLGENAQAVQLLGILQARQIVTGNGSFDNNAFSDIAAFEMLGRAGDIDKIGTAEAITYLLGQQDAASGAWTGSWQDVMTTAEAVRALKYLEPHAGGQGAAVTSAINNGCTWLQARQQANGGFCDATGFDDPAVDTSEVIYTLKLLGIDQTTWSNGGKSAVDYVGNEVLNADKTFGTSKNIASDTWILDAYLKLEANIDTDTALGLDIAPTSANIAVNATQQYTAKVYTLGGSLTDVTSTVNWSADDATVASVNNGVVQGLKVGNTDIKATLNGLVESVALTVASSGGSQNAADDELATQALRNNYGLYQGGQDVDGGWGNFSSYDAFIINLAGADLETWDYEGTSFQDSVVSLIDESITNEATANKSSSKRLAQDYLAAKSLGDVKAGQLLGLLQARQTATGNGSFDNNAFSDIAAFEMLGRAGDMDKIGAAEAITYLLGQQDAASGAWTGSWQDVMTTAEAVRALKYLEPHAGGQGAAVTSAINNGCTWLQARQQDNGGFCDATGFDDPAVDTAEVIYTLDLLNIDPAIWNKNGKNVLDYMQNDALNLDQTFGSSKNISSNTWVLDAYLKLGASIDAGTVLGLNIAPPSANIAVNGTQQFTAVAYTLDGSLTDVTSAANWSADDAAVASVNNGLVQGLKVGITDITATLNGVVGSTALAVASSGGASGQVSGNTIDVYIAVVGKDGNLLYAPGSVQISKDDEFGLTAMSALDATGLSWSFETGWDGLVGEIEGDAHEGSNGWCGKRIRDNSSTNFWDVPKEIPVIEGDKIIFWYSINANFNGPDWDNLFFGNTIQITIPTIDKEKTKETINSYKDVLDQLLKETNPNKGSNSSKVLNADKGMTREAAKALKNELDSNQVAVSEEVGRAEAVLGDIEVSLLVPENALSQTKNLSIKELSSNEVPQQFGIKVGSSTYEFGPSGTKFDKPLTISLKIPITEDINIASLSPAWYDEQSKQWIPIPGIIDIETGLVVFQINHFTKFALIELPKAVKAADRITFTDVNEDIAWAKDAIEILAGKGIIKGIGEGVFEPQRSMNRAEFIQMLVNALQLETNEYKNGIFSDVDSSNWFAASVTSAYNNKIISGYPDGTFDPHNSISRNEVASIFHHIEDNTNSINDVNLVFQDIDSIPAWASNGVKYVYKQGIMKGYEDGTFKGSNPLSRAEAAVAVYQYLNFISKM